MRIFKTRWFGRFARHEEISDKSLREAIERAERGLVDADLGGGLIKQRVARQGKGKSGGYRTIIAYRSNDKAFFIYGFAKSDRENIESDELKTLREIASDWLAADEQRMTRGIGDGELKEVLND